MLVWRLKNRRRVGRAGDNRLNRPDIRTNLGRHGTHPSFRRRACTDWGRTRAGTVLDPPHGRFRANHAAGRAPYAGAMGPGSRGPDCGVRAGFPDDRGRRPQNLRRRPGTWSSRAPVLGVRHGRSSGGHSRRASRAGPPRTAGPWSVEGPGRSRSRGARGARRRRSRPADVGLGASSRAHGLRLVRPSVGPSRPWGRSLIEVSGRCGGKPQWGIAALIHPGGKGRCDTFVKGSRRGKRGPISAAGVSRTSLSNPLARHRVPRPGHAAALPNAPRLPLSGKPRSGRSSFLILRQGSGCPLAPPRVLQRSSRSRLCGTCWFGFTTSAGGRAGGETMTAIGLGPDSAPCSTAGPAVGGRPRSFALSRRPGHRRACGAGVTLLFVWRHSAKTGVVGDRPPGV